MTYHPIAVNHAEASENRIHSDDIARRYGFSGALVPGVAVFGYMSHELTAALGPVWLGSSIVDLRLVKPAYAGDRLTIERTEIAAGRQQVECRNSGGTLLATLTVELPARMPDLDPRARIAPREPNPPRTEISWDAIHVDQPFAPFVWQPSAQENRTYTEYVADELECYRTGVLHPHLIQHVANAALVRRFVLPAWVHVGTEMRFHRTLMVDDTIEVRTLPIEKWERKGHQFIKLYIAYAVAGAPAVEAYHTAIFRLADQGSR